MPNFDSGSGLRQQVFEVIVRQAMIGAPWREICAGPMLVNRIAEAEVEAEVRRRTDDDNGMQSAYVPKKPNQPYDQSSNKLALPTTEDEQPESDLQS